MLLEPENLFLQVSMHNSARSTTINCLHRCLRYSVHLPKPGAISKIVSVGTKRCILGKMVPHHSWSVPPQDSRPTFTKTRPIDNVVPSLPVCFNCGHWVHQMDSELDLFDKRYTCTLVHIRKRLMPSMVGFSAFQDVQSGFAVVFENWFLNPTYKVRPSRLRILLRPL